MSSVASDTVYPYIISMTESEQLAQRLNLIQRLAREGLTVQYIAEQTGTPPQTVRMLMTAQSFKAQSSATTLG